MKNTATKVKKFPKVYIKMRKHTVNGNIMLKELFPQKSVTRAELLTDYVYFMQLTAVKNVYQKLSATFFTVKRQNTILMEK